MGNLFSVVLNMSMTGSIVILLVMLARLILKRAPKIFSYALWAVVLFRLLCPVAFTAPVSVLNALEPKVQEASESTSVIYFIPAEVNQNPDFTFVPAENQSGTEPVQEEEPEHTRLDLMTVASYVWLSGTGIMIAYSVIQYVRLRLKLIGAMAYRGNVYRADYIDTPFVMGIFSPKIYLPSDVPTNERKYIIAHERHHISRCDHIIKLLAYFALCIHWFNPLVWAAFILAGKDMEMSCDEAVIRKMGSQIRADYSASLLRLATHKKIIAGMPLAFGEGDTKGRVMNMAKWKKPKLWVCIICFALCAAVLVACAVNPEQVGQFGNSNSDGPTTTFSTSQNDSVSLDSTHMDGPVSAALADFHFTLPEGMSIQSVSQGYPGYIFFSGEVEVGGIALRQPEPTNSPDSFSEGWLTAMGVPEASDPTMGYMGGGSIYADYEITYFPDMPVNRDANGNIIQDEIGTYVLENEVTHYFFANDKDVYDIWFYDNRLPNGMREKLLKSCYIEGVTDLAAMESARTEEEEALAKCRAVLDAVQSASCHIVMERSATGDSESHWSTANYYQDNGNWLEIVDVAPESVNIVDGEQYSLRMAFMVANGVRYSNEGKWGKAYTDIDWREDNLTFDDSVKPWLASFQWDDSVAYMDTLTDENGECVMLRVDEKYKDSDEYDPHYFLYFNFDPDGNFVNAQLQINLFSPNELAITESIVSLDPKTVNAEIQKEYQNAVG